jgi:hypothetical protein
MWGKVKVIDKSTFLGMTKAVGMAKARRRLTCVD